MSTITKGSQRINSIQLVAGIPQSISNFDNTIPTILQIKDYSLINPIYISETGNVSYASLKNIVAGSIKVFAFPSGINSITLLCASSCQCDVISYETDSMSSSDLDSIQNSIIQNSTVSSSVIVTSMPPLASGSNNIGNVSLVGSITVSSLPQGHNIIDTLPPIPAGTNVMGHVIVDTLPPIPTGTNVMGHVIVDSSPVVATNVPTLFNVTMTTANSEYNQALPANTKKVLMSVQAGNSSFNYRYAFVSGKAAPPISPFKQYNGDIEYGIDNINIASGTIYFACSLAGQVMQIECWT
jgi:hypothetical protein